jgi:flagellar biogenesis protein FliO
VSLILITEDAARLGADGLDLTRYFLVVGALLGAVLVAGLLLKRVISGSLKARASKRSLAVVDVLPLGGKRQLAVVRCYDRTFALGLGDKGVSLVAELDAVIGKEETAETNSEPFERLLDVARTRLAQRRRGEQPVPVQAKELIG